MIENQARDLGPLRRELLVETPGASIAYFTDFYLDEAGIERVAPLLSGCDTLVCEAQYRHADLDLARRNHHMTATLTARLAKAANVGRLVLFHISERYEKPDQQELLTEAQAIFPATSFPDHW
jgi:ribonuclease Z